MGVVARFDVFLVNLDSTVNHEIQKTRPCLIISPNEMNEPLRTVIVADAGQTLQLLQTTSRGFLWFLVVTVSTYHLMTEWETLRERIFLIAPEAYQKDMRRLYMEIRAIWWSYMRG